ncbi:uncharacterized protein LOC136091826 [Hydra vulgaris]|uniref:Uncharacterized protein LOC136091826 n=1 Tax=Hydra vulgaris TaxID=6087 RepID=A0ABM4DM43_HYDVU
MGKYSKQRATRISKLLNDVICKVGPINYEMQFNIEKCKSMHISNNTSWLTTISKENEINEKNEINEENEVNEKNEVNEENKINEINEEKEINKSNKIKHQDFTEKFDGKKWTASWNWNKELAINNTIREYKMSEKHESSYRKEINEWINSGILVPYNEQALGPPKVLIPLMCVVQENKGRKIRPVGDFRALNEFVNCHTANVDVCQEKLRRWRKIESAKILDLKKAYLQIHIDKKLWPYQTVIINGERYCFTRMCFGINVAPTIMTTILRHVLNMNSTVKKACDNYINDIFVDESVETAKNVAKHLEKFGLQCKPPEELEKGRVLGLRVERNKNGELIWKRDNVVQFESSNAVTRSQLFSNLDKLIGHYPVAGKKEDSVGGKWLVPVNGKAELYCDASSIGLGVVFLIGGIVIEDAAWLRPTSDTHHINISELDSILRGLNLASKWDIKELTVYSDSKSTVGWLNALLKEEYRVKTRGISQLLVQRRLNTIKEIAKDIKIIVQWILSELNLADRLSQIPQKWCRTVCATGIIQQKDIWKVHSIGHFGVDRTLQLCLRNNLNV